MIFNTLEYSIIQIYNMLNRVYFFGNIVKYHIFAKDY